MKSLAEQVIALRERGRSWTDIQEILRRTRHQTLSLHLLMQVAK